MGWQRVLLLLTVAVAALAQEEAKRKNASPVAIVKPPSQSVYQPNFPVLDGSSSTDDDKIVQYKWELVSGPLNSKKIEDEELQKAMLVLKGLSPGLYQFKLTVTDSDGAEDSTNADVTVMEVPDSPAEHAEDGPTPLIRCKRPLCDTVCDFDVQTDSNGCITCECMEDPCKSMTCPASQRCIPIPCDTYPCEKLEARCGARPIACPLIECTRDCPFGYKKDLSGCDLCECKSEPCQDVDCGVGQRCQAHRPCPTGDHCDFEPRCVPDDGHELPRPQTGCTDVMCLMACEFGFEKDEDGCEMCSCSDDPCNNHECSAHEICQAQTMDCVDEDGNCPIYPTCVAKPLCHFMRDRPDVLTSMGMSVGSTGAEQRHVRCQPNSGEFEYTQCGENNCWCVDDRGVEVPDTRQTKPLTDEPSSCIRNRTHSVDVRFNMTHNLPHVKDHLPRLTEVTITKVTQWLSIEEDYVTGMELIAKTVDIVEVHFLVVRGVDDEVDLPTAVFHMHYEMHTQRALVDYNGQTFTPDPDSLSTEHKYEPLLPSGGGLRPWDSSEEGYSSDSSHSSEGSDSSHSRWDDDSSEKHSWLYNKCFGKKGRKGAFVIVMVTSLCLGVMLITGIVCACKCTKRRRTQRYDMQKANLAFANDLYSTMHKVGGEEDKVKLHDDTATDEKNADGTLA